MRKLLLPVMLLAIAPVAMAQPARPQTPPPASTASIEERQDWCTHYAGWLVAQTPAQPLPSDARPTQRYETEFNSCMLDPQQYERETHAEAQRVIQSENS